MHARAPAVFLKLLGGCVALASVLFPGDADAQWRVAMRSMANPLALGQCAAIEVVALDASGAAPMRPDGKQVSGWDFELSFTSAAPDAFAWKDEFRRFLCARAPSAATATVVATYPARHLKPNQIVPGVIAQQQVEVAMAGGTPPPPVSYAQPPANPQPAGYPQPVGYPQPTGYPSPDPYAHQSPTAADPTYPQRATSHAPAQPAPAAVQPVDTGVRTGKQFVERITGQAKRKASEVAVNTSTHVADAAGDVVGTTLDAGSEVVKSGTRAVTGAASESVEGVGRSLGAASDPKDPADVAATLAEGRAVFRGLRFAEGTATLEPSSGALISRIAGALARMPGQFLIEGHVDGKNAAADQALSVQRAVAVKAALVAAGGSAMQLAAVGYGSTRPIQGAKSSTRIEIVRTQ